ncbi:MAG: KH domain-containing protein [Myxococcaceae bacterium]|nr:KH domain-containing protein [Myxococcaceae bacterium]MBH2006601.1 KH domain-containing protein [Myxococcaceae bacterium]
MHYLVTSLVEHPEEVQIEEKQSEQDTTYAIHVSRADLGKVIGKKGRTAKAMRILISAFAAHQNRVIGLEIVEPPVEQKSDESVAA